jgi:hypothetical protein
VLEAGGRGPGVIKPGALRICMPCLFSWKPRLFSLFVYVAVGVTVGVSGFEGGERGGFRGNLAM